MSTSDDYRSMSYPTITRAILLTFCVVIMIFIVYEVIERLWLQDLSNQAIHFLHLMRGLLTSLIAALLVGWFIIKASPTLFSSKLTTDTLTQVEWPGTAERLDNFNRWFILMRWIAILVAWLLTYLIVQVAEWLPQNVWWPLVFTIGTLAILNLSYEYIYQKSLYNQFLLSFQAYADLVILVILLHFSGGIENPLSLLMLIHVIIAGIVLNRTHCYLMAATASILLAIVATAEATGFIEHYTLTIFPHVLIDGHLAHASHQPFYVISYVGLLSGIFFLTAYFVTTLADRIRHSEHQLKSYAKQALDQRKLIEKALETTGTGLCVCNNNAEPFWTNQRWEEWFGKKTADSVLKQCRHQELGPVCKSLIDGKTRINEITLTHELNAEHQGKILQITSAPLLDHKENINQVVSLVQDITEQDKAQKQLIRAGKLAAVGELAGHIAHEVNNPIGIISAKCRLLLEDHQDDLSPKVHQEIVKVIGAADRVAHIAKGLLSYCRPSVAKRTDMDIGTPIREALAMIQQHASELNVEIDDQLPISFPLVNANVDEIQQVFLNLFLNALDAMPDGGTLTLTASEVRDSSKEPVNWIVIRINDTGTGIPVNLQDQVFEPFFTTKTEGKGTGLGLSVCKGLIRSHGGTIQLESNQGHGTTISITLPLTFYKQGVAS